MDAASVAELPGNPLVVEYAPQVEVISRARLTITHAGLNTVLDSLSYGVPLVAIPITFEQPGNAARIRHTGSGEVIPVSRLSENRLRQTIERVLTEESYLYNAQRIKNAIAQSGGVKKAASIIEQCLKSESDPITYAPDPRNRVSA